MYINIFFFNLILLAGWKPRIPELDQTRSCDSRTAVAGTSGTVPTGTSETWGTWQGAQGPSWHYLKLGDRGTHESTFWGSSKQTSVATSQEPLATTEWASSGIRTTTEPLRQPWLELLGQGSHYENLLGSHARILWAGTDTSGSLEVWEWVDLGALTGFLTGSLDRNFWGACERNSWNSDDRFHWHWGSWDPVELQGNHERNR